MPLLVDGTPIKVLPPNTDSLFASFPSLKESSISLTKQDTRVVSEARSLYVAQREIAIVSSQDKQIDIVGTDGTTTCCSVCVYNRVAGVIGFAHFDGSGLEDGVDQLVQGVSSNHSVSGDSGQLLELNLAGGFLDDRNLSEQIAMDLLATFHKQPLRIELVTAAIVSVNNTLKGEDNFPVIYGLAASVSDGNVFPALFTDKGPVSALRSVRMYSQSGDNMLNIYDTENQLVKIVPFHYRPYRHVLALLAQSDEFLLENLSTSPKQEPPDFVDHLRETFRFMRDNPSSFVLFPGNKPLLFRKNETSQWVTVE